MISTFPLGVRCSVHQITDKGGQTSLSATKHLNDMVSVPTFVLLLLCFLFAATKLLIAPVVLLLVVVVGAIALVIGNGITHKNTWAH